MLLEAWQYFRTKPRLPFAKSMGYVTEAIAMQQRAKRCQTEWQSHYQHCQNAILNFTETLNSKTTLVIIGAGSTQDIPLKQLSEQFEKVLLVDIVFLQHARNAIKPFNNIELLELDITNSVLNAFEGNLSLNLSDAFTKNSKMSAVISLNLITQLPLLPLKWLQNQKVLTSEEQALIYAQTMIKHHLKYLQTFPNALLIADKCGRSYQNNRCVDEHDPWWDLLPPEFAEEWQWKLIPEGEVEKGYSQIHTVGVVTLR